MQSIKALSHSDNPIIYKVYIHDIDITEYISSIDSIRNKSDYPEISKFRVDDASLTILDDEGYFNANNDDNFFIENDLNSDGFGASLKIEAGFDETLSTLFDGCILQLSQISNAISTIRAVDKSHDLFRSRITDFGIERTFKLVDKPTDDLHGFYPIPEFLFEISEGSDSIEKDDDVDLTRVEKLSESGSFDSDNYVVNNDGIRTEGGLPDNIAAGYPKITFKSPYKGKSIKRLIDLLLDHADVDNKDVILPEPLFDAHFTDNGRHAYNFIGTGTHDHNVPPSWQGHITDYAYHASSNCWFYLYNTNISDNINRSRLVRHTVADDTWDILWESIPQVGDGDTQSGIEVWNLCIRNQNRMAMMMTSSDVENSIIDVEETISTVQSGNNIYIVKLTFDTPVRNLSLRNGIFFHGVEQIVDESKVYRASGREENPSVPSLSDIRESTELDTSTSWLLDSNDRTHIPAMSFVIYLKVKASSSNFEVELKENFVRSYLKDTYLPDLQDIIPESGSYLTDFEGSNNVFISEYRTGQALNTIVPTDSDYKPVLANFYQFGESGLTTLARQGFIPPFAKFPYFAGDNRRNMFYASGRYYFCYVNRTLSTFGVAGVNSSGNIRVINSFGINALNYANINFILEGTDLWTIIANKTALSSKIQVHKHSITQAPT